ncbi:hypothetical protein [Streptomyces roseolus]|uniref:hypothetical protein n=1 Tax=Streptomyces roseolus TaxID=67358 RepID=UPI0019A92595|nr:hypothetical protein [Streptomyces roseolus]GGR36726.1 hypothetical protein GCM10010282_31550 [Streptomyces roseolus]
MSEVTTTDLYDVTMALPYLRAPATFSLCVRDLPPGRRSLVVAGPEPALGHLARIRADVADIEVFACVVRRLLTGRTETGS